MNRLSLFSFFSLRSFFLLLTLTALAGRMANAGQTDISMDLEAKASIRLTPINGFWDGLGWMPVLVHIQNSSSYERTWAFEFTAGLSYNNGGELRLPVSIRVPAGATTETTVMVPGSGVASVNWASLLNVAVTGPGVSGRGSRSMGEHRELNFRLLGLSKAMELPVSRLTAGLAKTPTGSSSCEIQVFNPLDWPADWRVWSSFTELVLNGDDYDALDGARRNAFREWVAQGGVLWLERATVSSLRDTPPITLFGLGLIHNGLSGFISAGTPDSRQRRAPWSSLTELVTDDDRADWALSQPVVALTIFLVLFGIVVGPLNVFVFAPSSRRQRLFLTVPALSLGASLLLVGVIVVKDGFGGAGKRRALVVLLAGENKAVVFQQQVARTGMVFGKQFALPDDTWLGLSQGKTPVRGESRQIERDHGQASGEWFNSRAVQTHELRRITPTRARVELVEGGGKDGSPPVVQSSLTTVLRSFRYVDAQRHVWTAAEVPPGRRVTLSQVDQVGRSSQVGTFTAEGGATDLAPLATLASIHWSDDTILYTGRVEAARQP